MSRSLEWVGTYDGKRVHVDTVNVGHGFATEGRIICGRKVLHWTDPVGYGSHWVARRTALRWLAQHGTLDKAAAQEYQLGE